MPFHDISEIETDAAYCAELHHPSIMVICSHGRTIQPGGMCQMTATVMRYVKNATCETVMTLTITEDGTEKSLAQRNSTNYTENSPPSANLKTSNLKNC